jgi:hypothetical protein
MVPRSFNEADAYTGGMMKENSWEGEGERNGSHKVRDREQKSQRILSWRSSRGPAGRPPGFGALRRQRVTGRANGEPPRPRVKSFFDGGESAFCF